MRAKTLWVLIALLALAAVAGAQTKISGTVVCTEPEAVHALEVGDHPGHTLMIAQGKCTWSKPMEIAGTQTKEDVGTFAVDSHGNKASSSGYVVGTTTSGDKFFVKIQGTTTVKNDVLESEEGKWSFIGGTGKLKGIKGGGTYKGKPGPDGTTIEEVEGEYELPSR
jgi:hypothetical protein